MHVYIYVAVCVSVYLHYALLECLSDFPKACACFGQAIINSALTALNW